MDDNQWKAVSQAIRSAGGRLTDGNRLHVDAVLDLMETRRPWRDLDYRYGPWPAVHSKFVRWFETGILHGIVMALFKEGLTEGWRETYTEITVGPSARPGPQIRPLMAQIANELRKHRDAPKKRGRPAAPKLPPPEGTSYRDKRKAYAKKVETAVNARKGAERGRITDADWTVITSRIPELAEGSAAATRRQIEELNDVMKTNKGWSYMDSKAGKWSVAYARFMKWVSDGTMARLVKCLAGLGLTSAWNTFLVAPLPKGERSLKLIIGAEAYLHRDGGKSRRHTRARSKAAAVEATPKAAAKPKAASKPGARKAAGRPKGGVTAPGAARNTAKAARRKPTSKRTATSAVKARKKTAGSRRKTSSAVARAT